MPDFKERLQIIQRLRSQRENSSEKLYISHLELHKTENLLSQLHRKETRPRNAQEMIARLETERRRLAEELERNKNEFNVRRDRLHTEIEGIFVEDHPRDILQELDDAIPFLLLPVRIETRFVTTGTNPELWLRIYPDDIAIHTHEKLLTDQEVLEGTKYWKELFSAEKSGGDQKEGRKKSAWSHLASIFGSQRAAWIARQTKPANWASDLSGIASEDMLVFPDHDHTKTHAWSRAPRTTILPDKFVVLLYEGDTIVREQVGRVIPDELFLGPDPFEAEEAFQTENDKLVFGESFDWISNFDKAVDFGMGFKIPLTPVQASGGFDKILVLGAFLSADETGSKQALEELIDNHHYSPNGFSIVSQGTPTNNTDQAGSGFTKNDPFNNTSYFVETGEPLFESDEDCDGRNLADALGIEYDPLHSVLNANGGDYKQAVMMNTVLYPATLGYFFETLLKPVLGEQDLDAVRRLFVDHVTGRGPLPAIRVGNQPYGVLLTSDFRKWKWSEAEPFFHGAFLKKTLTVLNHYQGIWDSLLGALMHVGKAGIDPSEVLMNLLGLQAGSVSFFQRIGYSTDYLKNLDDFQYDGKYAADMTRSFDQKNVLLNLFAQFGYQLQDESGNLKVPQALRLIYQHYTTLLDASNLIDNLPLSEEEMVRDYDPDVKKNYLHWLADAASIAALQQQDFGAGKAAPTSLLYLLLRRALLLQLHKSTVLWFKNHDVVLDQTLQPANFYNIRPQGDLTKYEVLKATVGVALQDHPNKTIPASEYLLTTGNNEDEAQFLNEMKASLTELAKLSTAKLERCFTEHLDACTYRLDAWQTALFRLRLLKQRSVLSSDERANRKKGVYLGAYGWLENIRPGNQLKVVAGTVPDKLKPPNDEPLFEYTDNGGFVHAPSLNHASAAAILRNGYLSHATPTNPDLMAVNLSSERVRRALLVLQGVRNGQPLEALLGYQFERGLHDRASANDSLKKLNLYIYDFRDRFPIQQHQIKQQGSPAQATESMPARNVVNGITLAENNTAFPYGATGDVTTANIEERSAIENEKNRLNDTLDAIKDLLLAEASYQMVQGNTDRAGSVLNALKDAHIPPEVDVIHTPRSSHLSFTNRVTIHFENGDPDLPEMNPWSPVTMSPRSRMETGMNRWLGTMLGAPADMVYRVSHLDASGVEAGSNVMTVADLELQPIDLTYLAGESELEIRIADRYREINALDNETIVGIEFMTTEVPGKRALGRLLPLIRMLKSLITDSRHLHAEDFDPPSKESLADPNNPKGYDVADLQARMERSALLYKSHLDDLGAITIAATVDDQDGVPHSFSDLKTTFSAMDEMKVNFSEITFTLSGMNAVSLKDVLILISNFGLSDAFPKLTSMLTPENQVILLEQAKSVFGRMAEAHARAAMLMTEAGAATEIGKKVDAWIVAAKMLFGDHFNILPLFAYNNEEDIQESNADRSQLLNHATNALKMTFAEDEWLQSISYVRPKIRRWDYIRTLTESLHDTSPELKAVQLPYRAKDSWLAVEFPETDEITNEPFSILHDTLSVVVHGDAAFTPAVKQSGLLIDDWTEVVPGKEEVTGIAYNYNQPNACPPQALLLAVTPQEKGHWVWDDLVGILNDTLQRAKRRAVEPILLDQVSRSELSVLLPALVSDFSQYDLNISLDYRINVKHFAETIPISPVSSLPEH